MNVTKITSSTPCFGICCPQHAQCQRYAAVEGHNALHVLDTCDPGDGTRPQFRAIRNEQGEHHAAAV
ncbi:MAG: hypothetical protein ACK44A_05430 [Roseateles sp.]